MTTVGVYSTARWVRIGALGWSLLAVVYILSMGLRNASYGFPFFASWWAIINPLIMTAAGAALTPLVLLGFRKGPGAMERRPRAMLLYVVMGVAYWLAWAGIVAALAAAGVIRAPGLTLPRAVIFMAYISLAAYAVLVMLYEAVRSLRQARERELEASRLQAELSRAQAAELRAMLNPDFLFDAFETASALMQRNARAARRVLADLGALLRASFGQNGSDLVSCQAEMELLERYLDIRRARPGSRLRSTIDVAPDAAGATVPPLLLQPLAEAMVGPDGEPGTDDVALSVSATRVGTDLRLRMLVSGWASGADAPDATAAIGRARLRSRLDAVYGDGVAVVQHRVLPGGTEVEIRLPGVEEAEPGDG